ncbi:TetR/AcrR family transcriptional regulator [Leifsonia aquatica]|uniref:TetR/AcrR family transcriptional regulator n=1 Tax=Leifsonia aquatica TaxID=144185 RepID=UPI00046AC056|nr:TetR/AcrR family transcriptional regulator [Leifsonia aquatica]
MPASTTVTDPSVSHRILEAAAEVFAGSGLDAGLAEIAERAGVGVATIYRRFATKDDIIQALAERRFTEITTRMRAAAQLGDPWEAFASEFRASALDFAADRGFRELVVSSATDSLGWARGTKPTALQESIARWSEEVMSIIGQLIERAHASGQLRADVDGPVVFQLSLAAQSIAALGDRDSHAQAIEIILDGLRSRTPVVPLGHDLNA